MIDLYFWPTPNGYKPLIALEEYELPYRIVPVNIFRGEQFAEAVVAISSNRRIPAMIDHDPGVGGAPVTVFESGAILHYLAERVNAFAGCTLQQRHDVMQWLFWQMGGLGPMMGQASHFLNYAPEDVPYGKTRYVDETRRLFGVLERRLADRDYLAERYSIADMACYPWVRLHETFGIEIKVDYPALASWVGRVGERQAVVRAYQSGEPIKGDQAMDETARPFLFGSHQPS